MPDHNQFSSIQFSLDLTIGFAKLLVECEVSAKHNTHAPLGCPTKYNCFLQ